MTAGDASRSLLFRRFERILDHLQAARTRYETAAQCHVLGQHMLDTPIGILDILPYNGDIDRDPGFGKYRIHTMQRLEDPFVRICVPGLARGHVHAFYSLSLWRF